MLRYCLGLMQGTWIAKLNLTTSEASVINSVTFAVTLLPAPAVQFLRDYYNVQPYIVFLSAATFVSIGLYLTSIATTFLTILISNGVVFSIGIVFSVTGTLTTVYHYFLDDKITLVSSCVSAGMGMGMVMVSMSFKYMEPVIGWRGFVQFELIFVISYVMAFLVFFPPISRVLGVRTRKMKELELKQLNAVETEGLLAENNNLENEQKIVVVEKKQKEDGSLSISNDSLPSLNNHGHDMDSISQSVKDKVKKAKDNLLFNPLFLLLLFSWVFNEATYNAVMVHQPERVVKMGYSLINGADTLAINGAVQIVARFSVGLIADRQLISVIRLSQLSKLTLGVMAIVSTFFPFLMFQTFFMFLVGACGGIVSTTDVILIKDCVKHGRELGISILLLMDGLSSFISIALAGVLYSVFESYNAVFIILGGSSLAAFVLVLILDVLMRTKYREREHTYSRM